MPAVVDFGGIELASGGGALTHSLVICRCIDRNGGCLAIAFALAAGGGFGAAQPLQAKAEHDGGGDNAEAGRG